MISGRYERNIGTVTLEEHRKLRESHVCVVGCGGLGGYIIEELARIGIGTITAVDGDVFQESNLNRQLLSTEAGIGSNKAEAARHRIEAINSEVRVKAISRFLTEENAAEIITAEYDVVIDALDNIQSRRLLEKSCGSRGLPLIHGAIAGWHGQVSVIYPEDRLFQQLYPEGAERGAETETGNPSFTPALVASVQVAEAVKVLLGRPGILRKKLLTIDLLGQEYDVIDV